MSPRKVLVTGVYGLIAGAVYQHLQTHPERYDPYALARRRHPSERAPDGRQLDLPEDHFHLADLTDLEALHNAMQGIDTVVQMAADPRPEASWENLLNSNIIGARNVFEAALNAGVKRVVFASSIMFSWGYQQDEPYKSLAEGRFDEVEEDEIPIVDHLSMPRPTGLYPASKVWGEALARYYADMHDLSALCLRIGWVNAEDHPQKPESGPFWCSQRDIVQLVERCIEAPDDLRFDIFYGVSDNKWRWVDIDHPRQVLGYVPLDSAEERLARS